MGWTGKGLGDFIRCRSFVSQLYGHAGMHLQSSMEMHSVHTQVFDQMRGLQASLVSCNDFYGFYGLYTPRHKYHQDQTALMKVWKNLVGLSQEPAYRFG